jgi:hypothetical protein
LIFHSNLLNFYPFFLYFIIPHNNFYSKLIKSIKNQIWPFSHLSILHFLLYEINLFLKFLFIKFLLFYSPHFHPLQKHPLNPPLNQDTFLKPPENKNQNILNHLYCVKANFQIPYILLFIILHSLFLLLIILHCF